MSRAILRLTVFVFVVLLMSSTSAVIMAQQPVEGPSRPMVQSEPPSNRGFVPPTMDLSHVTSRDWPQGAGIMAPPERLDWSDSGMVSSVKNQSSCGSCYAFASLANIESRLLMDGQGEYNFSENNAKECNYSQTSCAGGNYTQMANLYSIKGTVLESCDPYVAADVSCNSSCTPVITLLDWRMISGDVVPNTTDLKNYILAYGPVYTTFYAGNADAWGTEFNNYNGSGTLYYTGTESPNHAVMIVGWDDTLTHAGGTGGWIVKNSWGTGWGDAGYFRIAYGSASIGKYSSFAAGWQEYDPSETLLYNDEGGWSNRWGYGATVAAGMTKLVPSADGYLTRVEFWTTDAATVDIRVYDDFNAGTGTLTGLIADTLDITYTEAGYHSLPLNAPPAITSGDDLYVSIVFNNVSDQSPIATDQLGPCTAGESYMSPSGAAGTWYDLSAANSNDVAIRLRTSPSLVLGVDDESHLTPYRYGLSVNYPNPFNPTTTIDYSLAVGSHVDISVYNLLGRKINTLVDEIRPAGPHSVIWNGTDFGGRAVASGVYFYKITAGDFSRARKMLLIK